MYFNVSTQILEIITVIKVYIYGKKGTLLWTGNYTNVPGRILPTKIINFYKTETLKVHCQKNCSKIIGVSGF